MDKFKLSALMLALFAANSALAANEDSTNQSPSTQAEDLEIIEVRGFSRSLIQSLNHKRFSDTVSEQISADDLGALPDISMADALTRLPGISAVRTGGQAAQINIRGLSGGFVFSTLNGREQVSTSGSRSIEFDQYPSELISSAAVYKSPKASLIEGGVAGTVELETASPLNNDQTHKFVANVRGMYNDRASEVSDATEFGDRISFSYQGKYLDDTLGVALGYARLFQPSVATQFIGLAYNDTKDVDGAANDTNGPLANPENEYISEGFELQHLGGEETRNGYLAAIEWAPVDNFKLKGDAFLSRFDKESFARGLRVKLGGPTAAYANAQLDGNAVIGAAVNRTSQSYTRVEIVNDDNQDFDEVDSFGVNADWQVTDRLNVNADVSLSRAKSNFRNGLLWSLVAEDANAETPVFDNNVAINYQLNGLNLPDVGFNQAAAFSDIDRVMVSKYGIYPDQTEDEVTAFRLDFKYELESDIFSSVEFGARYSDREYSRKRSVFEYGNDGAFSATQPPLRLTDDMASVVDWQGEFSYFPSYLAIDLDKALNAWFPDGTPKPVQTWGNADGVDDAQGYTTNYSWSVLQSGSVFEDVLAAYVMVNINTQIAGLDLSGNVGVRRIETDQSATVLENVAGDARLGAQNIVDENGIVNNLYAPNVLGTKYTDYLPSLNLNLQLNDNSLVRFAAAKVMSRAPINRLAGDASANVSDDGVINGSSNNNPFLKPFYADQYDLSYEYYFEEGNGTVAAALFYKNIDSFVEILSIENFDFKGNGFNVPDFIEDPVSSEQVATTNGIYTTAVNNGEGGYIRGLELAYTQVFTFLPSPFNGLGANASYSYTESEIESITSLGGDTLAQSLPGLSNNVLNATVFYSMDDFETRLNVRYRDEFVSEQVAINEQVVNFDAETVVDFQTSYRFSDSLTMLLQVNNLTDEPTQSYFGSEQRTGTTQYFGRQFYLGFTYSH
ncbi:TonB-dependent receptor [Pseudoalteromonas sp. CST5]|uniref:TonB-dependent receptor n=1 Tax=unclassified Pseudoalteromonas TaxID=194690 RepID=UPI0023583C88|nr:MULTISPECIES: TonB-dependent receptor [unclassified Pseudoalteromonas]MDC9514373.1 TonB-dependent receptor [Pseudoalteromonas sp. CST1]MDC9538740.1 TonB-dependent receptor [Pseudoalteromonas sp. CST3]MDC9542955.1 TonB-dependent receptor [Pseudoalteromonas sp. CST2]MDC9547215.1 TonB-dependent receptor [Pseudoalteromonas sp. CST4]MDC9550489.1 TonB-dependent receptor [Pseudoalteromonas sp. CST5]